MGRVRGMCAVAGCLFAALLLGGCETVEQMAYRPSLAAAEEPTATPAVKLPATLTKVAVKKKAPIPRPVYRKPKPTPPVIVRRPINIPGRWYRNAVGGFFYFDPDGPP